MVFFDRSSEIDGEYLKKGLVGIDNGRQMRRMWSDKDGVEKYTTEILDEQVQRLAQSADTGPRIQRRSRAPASTTWTTTFSSPALHPFAVPC